MPRTLPGDIDQACPELPTPKDGSQGESFRAYAKTVELYGECAGRVKGWRDWAKAVVK